MGDEVVGEEVEGAEGGRRGREKGEGTFVLNKIPVSTIKLPE